MLMEKIIEKRAQNKDIPYESFQHYDHVVAQALYSLMLINLKVKLSIDGMTKSLNKIMKIKNLPKASREHVQAWLQALSQYKEKKLSSLYDSSLIVSYIQTTNELLAKTHKLEEKEIHLSLAAGNLSKFLFRNPKSEITPHILYWLGTFETTLSKNLFFSLEELYLKSCIYDFDVTDISQKCLDSYQEKMNEEFTGTRGTDIPKDIQNEMNKMKLHIQKNLKKEKK
jgi:hypothetical protein